MNYMSIENLRTGVAMKCLFIFASLVVFSGCVYHATVVPIEGPLSQDPKVLDATFTWNGSGHGQMTIVLPSGEVCKGKYTTVPDGVVASGTGMLFSQAAYANYFGSGVRLENKQFGQGILVGDKGTTIQVEYVTSASSPTHGYGLAKDSNGNIYKIIY